MKSVKDADILLEDEASCPFCEEKGFDLIGLKDHIEFRPCEKYLSTISIAEERNQNGQAFHRL